MGTHTRKAGRPLVRFLVAILALLLTTGAVTAQRSTEDRLDALEQQIAELRRATLELAAPGSPDLAELKRQVEVLSEELENLSLGETPEASLEDGAAYGFGPAASKVYRVEQGLSIGGYGEMLFESYASDREDGESAGKKDTVDYLRGVFYIGYKFDDRWVFNSEIEFEHASTSESGSASVEFGYLDYLWKPKIGLRTGLLLVPMGFLNELHEPPLFLSAERPNVEKAIIPTTWRENGVGVFGDIGPFSYRTYIVNGLNGAGFSSSGVRGGRQKGAKALAEDLAWTGRLDYTATPGLTAGISAYIGDSGQGLLDPAGHIVGARTEIFDIHLDWKYRGFHLRALAAQAEIGDAARLNQALGKTGSASVGERLEGHYVEMAYDLLARSGRQASFLPFVRMETLDTQARVPTGYSRSGSKDTDILTFGFAFQPIDRLIFKIDHQDWSNAADTGVDQWNLAMGYLF